MEYPAKEAPPRKRKFDSAKRRAIAIALVGYFAFLIFNMVKLREDYPFTAASMFARYIDKDTNLYSIELFAEFEESTEPLDFYSYPINRRILFYAVYCSDEPSSPYYSGTCDENSYLARMGSWFEHFQSLYFSKHGALPKRFVLQMLPRQGSSQQPSTLATFECSTGEVEGWEAIATNR